MTRSKPQSCSGCPCYSHGTDFTKIEGTGSSGIMVVAEASGEMEARDGLPLRPYAPAGGVFERVLRRMSLDRERLSITNCLRCRPKNNWLENAPWEYPALNACRPNLAQAIRERQPRCIVALGGIPTRELTGLAGEKLGVNYLAGYVVPLQVVGLPEIPVIVNWHPSYLRRGAISHMGAFARIMQRAVNIALGRDREYLWAVDPADPATWGDLKYQTHPSLDDCWAFYNYCRDNPAVPIAQDIETPESVSLDEDAREGFSDTHVRLIQFSAGRGTGIAIPFCYPYMDVIVALLHLPNLRYGHNWALFDHKVLEAASARDGWRYAPTARLLDTLDMFHHWQPDLPAHLQFASSFIQFRFPWKHFHTLEHEPFYGCCDVDSDWQLGEMLVQTLKRDQLWGDFGTPYGYCGQVADVRPVLAQMEKRGLPVDNDVRLALGDEFRKAGAEIALGLMSRFPESAKKLDPYKPNKKGELVVPPELRKLPEEEWGQLFQEPDKEDAKGNVKPGKWYRYGIRTVKEAAIGQNGEPTLVDVERWCYIPEFNPNSGPQLIEYMKAKGHKVPRSKEEDAEGNQKQTTAKKELVRLANKVGDDFYLKVIEYRELSKMKGTYVDGFRPHSDGCVHTTFTFDTGIGQLSSRNPNIQNFGKHGRLAKATRKMVAAKPGHLLSEWDFKSCHVLTLGYLANDPNYIRLARIDMHSIMTGHYLKLWRVQDILHESDDELKARCKWLKANEEYKHTRDAKIKHAGLGIGNGLKYKGLFERYMEYFSSQREAKAILDDYEEVFPRVFAWQKQMQKLAHEQQFLRTEFGHIRRFYEVFKWDSRKGDWSHGDQAEAAISFWLSNIAFGHIREKLKALARLGLDAKYGLCNNIHDSFLFHFPAEMKAEHIAEVQPVLVSPSEVLKGPAAPNGLWIGVDCAMGHNWAEMEELKLPEVKDGFLVAKGATA